MFPPGENITAQLRGSVRMVGVFLGRESNRADARFGSDDGFFPGRDGLYGCMCINEYIDRTGTSTNSQEAFSIPEILLSN